MRNWLTSNKAKVHQRRMNKFTRSLNQNIKNDDLWRGRFYVHQLNRERQVYEDHSGMEVWVTLEFVDKKTHKTKVVCNTVNYWTSFPARLWWEMNNFIVDDVSVWSENPAPNSKEWFTQMDWVEE